MKKFFVLALTALCALPLIIAPTCASADNTIVVDTITGYVFASKNPTEKVPVGNLTKVASAMVVLDWAARTSTSLDQLIAIPQGAFVPGAANPIGLVGGDQISIRDLLFSSLLASDDVATQALAIYVGGRLKGDPNIRPDYRFVAQMNALARVLHMTRTRFTNAYGLANGESQPYSTAADMARLGIYVTAKPAFTFFVSQKSRRVSVTRADGSQMGFALANSNQLLGTESIDGVKTGSTSLTGECEMISSSHLPESVKQGTGYTVTPRRLIVVVLHAQEKFSQALGLVQQGWQQYAQWAAAGRPAKPEQKL